MFVATSSPDCSLGDYSSFRSAVMSQSEGSTECSGSSDSGNLLLFDQLNVTKLKVVGYNCESKRFSVQVELNTCCEWSVEKTYANFVELHKIMAKDVERPLPKNTCKGKRPKQEALEQLRGQLEAYLNGLLAVSPGSTERLVAPRTLLEFLEYRSRVIDVGRITDDLVAKTAAYFAAGNDEETIQMSSLELHCMTRRLASLSADPLTSVSHSTGNQLRDCIAKMKGIHVSQQSAENISSSALRPLTLDLSPFRSLTLLKLECIRRTQLTGMEYIVHQLLTLAVHQCIQTLSDILVYYPIAPQNTMTLSEPDISSGLPWARLMFADLKNNHLRTIDPSIRLLPALTKLDLSCNQISEIENMSELSYLEMVDLSYNSIRSLQGASHQLGHVKELRLSHNQISCLDGLEKLSTLTIVDLSLNEISSEVELRHLTLLHLLEELHLHGNPICTSTSYRSLVLCEISPRIGKITLDGKEPSFEEQITVNNIRSTCHQVDKQGSQSVDIPVLFGRQSIEHVHHCAYEVIGTPKMDPEAERQNIMWRLEQMRKEGGDEWLEREDLVTSIHIATAAEGPVRGGRTKEERKKRHTKKGPRKEVETEKEKVDMHEESANEQSAMDKNAKVLPVKRFSDRLQQLIDTNQIESNKAFLRTPASFSVAILEYGAPLHHLCPHDIDHLMGRGLLEEAVVTISSGEVKESLATDTTSASRPTRDLSTLQVVHVHEGKMVAVCLSHAPDTSWVIYAVQDLAMAASLYLALQQAAPQRLNREWSSDNQQRPVENTCVFPATTSVQPKPGLESQELMEHFKCTLAKEKNEALIHVEWGTSLLPSCFLCGTEAGVFVSNSHLYLVEVLPQPNDQVSWKQANNLPLRLMAEASLDELCRVTVGPHSLYLHLELSRRASTQCFTVVPHTPGGCTNLVQHIRAALDGYSIPHVTTTTTGKREMVCSKERNVVQIVGEEDEDCQEVKEGLVRDTLQEVREGLVRDTLLTKTATCEVVWEEFEGVDLEEDVKQASSKVAIKHYMVAWEMVSDIIPSSNGVCGLQLRALVLTQDSVYLCREDMLSRLVMGSIPLCPSSLLSFVLDCHPIFEVTGIKECDKACLLSSPSNPVYQFSIAFGGHGDGTTGSSSGEWVLCVHNSQSMDQFISFLSKAWCGIHGSPLPHGHTTVPLLDPCPRPSLDGEDMQGLRFYTNRALLELCSSSYDRKVEFFKEHCSVTSMEKVDDPLQGVFIGRGRSSYRSLVEIEVCIVVSKYSIYLLSTLDDARLWKDTKVSPSSVQTKHFGGNEGLKLQCIHQMWLSDIKEVTVGLFHLAVQLNTAKPSGEGVVIITQLAESTLALLGAIAGAVDLKDDVAKETMLRDFDDVSDDPITMSLSSWRPQSQRSSASFRQALDTELGDLVSLLASYTSETGKHPKAKLQQENTYFLCQQVMVLAGKMNTQSPASSPQNLVHLVLLTNHGLFLCSNDSYSHHSPAVFGAHQLRVKKWCPVEQIGHVEVTVTEHCIKIYSHQGHKHTSTTHQSDQQKRNSTHSDQPKHDVVLPDLSTHSHSHPTLHLIAQNSELVQSFVYHLSLLWSEKNGGKRLTVRQTYI